MKLTTAALVALFAVAGTIDAQTSGPTYSAYPTSAPSTSVRDRKSRKGKSSKSKKSKRVVTPAPTSASTPALTPIGTPIGSPIGSPMGTPVGTSRSEKNKKGKSQTKGEKQLKNVN